MDVLNWTGLLVNGTVAFIMPLLIGFFCYLALGKASERRRRRERVIERESSGGSFDSSNETVSCSYGDDFLWSSSETLTAMHVQEIELMPALKFNMQPSAKKPSRLVSASVLTDGDRAGAKAQSNNIVMKAPAKSASVTANKKVTSIAKEEVAAGSARCPGSACCSTSVVGSVKSMEATKASAAGKSKTVSLSRTPVTKEGSVDVLVPLKKMQSPYNYAGVNHDETIKSALEFHEGTVQPLSGCLLPIRRSLVVCALITTICMILLTIVDNI